jgi:hypothetical protein
MFLAKPPGDQLGEDLREGAEHVVARARAPRLARLATGPLEAASAELHDQLVNVSAGQVLNSQVAQLAAHGLQDVFIARGRRGSDLVARPQLIRAGLLHRERGSLHIGAGIYLALVSTRAARASLSVR